ncbi:hypothetical protein, partial [Streptomyces acidiscabies]|uniref:hypothetical protein n=1 Tax=Streptomyces acidiscabies TaxID=42234 RepID=UPI0038F74A9C
ISKRYYLGNSSYFGNTMISMNLVTNTNNFGYLAQSIHYHSVGMVIALELHVHFRMNISFEVSIR